MDKYTLYDAIGEAEDGFLIDAEQVINGVGQHKDSKRKIRGTIIAIAAVIAVLGTVAAADMGFNIVDWIAEGFRSNIGTDGILDSAVLQEEIDAGQWFYLNEDHIAVIIPESPVKIMLSDDAGATWRESVVTGSDGWDFLGEWGTNTQYWGGYIGFNGDENGYLVLTSGAAMNHQDLRIYLTDNKGATWHEIGNPYHLHISVLTGAGFASEQVGFISYRYFEDNGPDIWWTKDGGNSWEKLKVEIPEEYAPDQHNFTPLSPSFEGDEGIYPIIMSAIDERTIYMYTHDGGLTWAFDPAN